MRVVSIGAGYFSKFHVEAWRRLKQVELVAICDFDIEKATKLAEEYDVPHTFTSFEEALKHIDFDIVDVITPPATHLDLCRKIAKAGKHIICQKPLAPTYEEAAQLINEMNASNVRFMVHENFRFQPWYRKIKELIDEEAIGSEIFSISHHMRMGDGWPQDAYLARQPYFRTMPRLLIFETGIHFIDVFRYLLGDVKSVFAKLRTLNPNIVGEDSGIVFFDFVNGSQAVLNANRYNEVETDNPRYTFGEMRIDGNGGTLRLDIRGDIFIKPLGQPESQISYHHEHRNFSGDCVYYTQQHFIECLVNNEEFENTASQYLKNLQIQEAIYESNVLSLPVDLKTDLKLADFGMVVSKGAIEVSK